VSCTKVVEEAIRRHDYIDYGETDFGVHALVPEARVFDKILGWREVYTVWARLNLGVLEGDDPAGSHGARVLAIAISDFACAPRNSNYVYKGETATPCNVAVDSSGNTSIDFGTCAYSGCGPIFIVANAGPDSDYLVPSANVMAYAPPLNPSSVTTCRIDSTKEMSDLLYLCRRATLDSANKRYVTTFSTWDKRNASYSFTHAVIALREAGVTMALFYYPFNTTYTKSSADIYRYLYDIAVGYQ